MTALRTALLAGFLAMVGVSCATPRTESDALPSLKAGQEPPSDTTEAGLWMEMDYLEARLRTSGRLLDQEPLETYVEEIVCRLAGPHCPDIRVYLIRTPGFNASMAPNGMMQVWTGLLLRATNEAQVAYVLGHEIAHYLRRHSLQQWRDVRLKSTLLASFNLATGAMGYGSVGNLAQILALGSIFAFSRENEREADSLGFELMVDAGYDPQEAPRIWETLLREQETDDRPEPTIFFSTHPSTAERIESLDQLASQAITTHPDRGWTTGEAHYQQAIAPIRTSLLEDELDERQYARMEVLLEHLMDQGKGQGTLRYYQGELFRLRGKPGDSEKALEAYRQALKAPDAPPRTHRAMGLIYLKTEQPQRAERAFRRYLESAIQPMDDEMIKGYLNRLASTD